MSNHAEVKKAMAFLEDIDRIVDDAYKESDLYSFYIDGEVQLSDSVRFVLSKKSAPVWNCGPSIHIYGCLWMKADYVLSVANSLGLFVDLMSDDLIKSVRYFVTEIPHYDFYNYEESPSDADGFYSEAFLDFRPAVLFLSNSPYFGTYKERFIYLLAEEDSCYSSYEDYYSNFFLEKMRGILAKEALDDFRVRSMMAYLEKNRSKIVRWFEMIDEEFLNAFEELDRRFDLFVKSLYRIE